MARRIDGWHEDQISVETVYQYPDLALRIIGVGERDECVAVSYLNPTQLPRRWEAGPVDQNQQRENYSNDYTLENAENQHSDM